MKTNKIKLAITGLLISTLFTSCAVNYEAIGKVSMLSVGKVDPNLKYKQFTTNSGGSKKELKSSYAPTVKAAIRQVLSNTPGGYFITNVTIYSVNDGYFAVSGDVWGVDKDTISNINPTLLSLSTKKSINTKN
ncbi:MAG TPA: hypothetical protein VNY36_04035 [Bacteroidia bacterium]|nr:hypothetical protein [Bacteroidia bacterium]